MKTNNSKSIKFIFQIFAILILLSISFWFKQKYKFPKITITKQHSSINLNPQFFKVFSLGLQRLYSSVLWVITLGDSDLEHYKEQDLNSWMYLRFNTITNIEPLFLEVYNFGGLYLSIIKDDDVGAKKIFDKGLLLYPKDKDLLFYSAYHYHFELADIKQAISLYERLVPIPGSRKNLPSLISKLKADLGDISSALLTIREALKSKNLHPAMRKKFETNGYALKAEIDLTCLNNKNTNCDMIDFFGTPYEKGPDKKFRAKQTWKPLKSFKKPKSP